MCCCTIISFVWLTVVEGPANPALSTEMWQSFRRSSAALPVLSGSWQGTGCLPQFARSWFQGGQAALMLGFASGKPYMQDVVFNRTRLAVKRGPWCFISGASLSTSLSNRLLLKVPVRKTHLVQLGEVLWLLLLPRNPFCCPGRPGQGSREWAQFTHTYPSLSGEQLSWILPPVG